VTRHSEIVSAGDVSIETYIDGDDGGPDVVIMPSAGRDSGDDFDHFAGALSGAGFRVLRPQPRGIGRSTGPMTDVNLVDLADDIAQVIGAVGHGPAVALGHAYGHFVACTVATSHPEMISAVILAAAAGRNIPPDLGSAPPRAGDLDQPADERLAALKLAFFAPGHDPSAWLTGWHPRTMAMQQDALHAAQAQGQLERYSAAGTAPILEIIAQFDPFRPRDQWRDLRNQLGPRVTTKVIENASHALFPEQPQAVACAVIGYLENLR